MSLPDRRGFAELGLHWAIDRARQAQNVDAATVALAEVLNWMHSLRDHHIQRLRDKSKPKGQQDQRYYAEELSQDDGKVLAAVIYARNLVHHELGLVVEIVDVYGDVYSNTYGALPRDARGAAALLWTGYGKLPKPPVWVARMVHTPEQQRFYQQYLDGKTVIPTLEDAQWFLVEHMPTVT